MLKHYLEQKALLLPELVCACAAGFLACNNELVDDAQSASVTITGAVADASDGSPCPGVIVGLTGSGVTDTTDLTGGYVLNNLRNTALYVFFKKEHYWQQLVHLNVANSLDLITLDTIRLERNYGILTGKILSAQDSSSPVAGALIKSANSVIACVNDSALTGADGYYALAYLAPDSAGWAFTVTRQSFAPLSFLQPIREGDSVHITKYVQPFLIVSGIVVENDKTTPISDVMVISNDDTAISDARGVFVFDRILPSPAGRAFTFSKARYESIVFMDTITRSDTLVPVIMKKSTGSLHGKVYLQGRRSHAGTVVQLSPGNIRDTTDTLGHYMFQGIRAGTYQIMIMSPGHYITPCSVNVAAHQSNMVDFWPVIRSGAIETQVDWYTAEGDTDYAFFIKDTLTVVSGGMLNIHAGTRVKMHGNARLIVARNGIFNAFGNAGRFVELRPASASDNNICLEFQLSPGCLRTAMHSRITNITMVHWSGFTASHCQFLSINETDTAAPLSLASGPEKIKFSNCDFIWINSDRTAVTVLNMPAEPEVSFKDCIFYAEHAGSSCNSFLKKADSQDTSVTLKITNCNLFTTCTPADSFFAFLNLDSANIFRLDPDYNDLFNHDFALSSSSPLLDKSTSGSYLGAMGAAVKTPYLSKARK